MIFLYSMKCVYYENLLFQQTLPSRQSKDTALTQQGIAQSHTLAQFLPSIPLNQIISSPYKTHHPNH